MRLELRCLTVLIKQSIGAGITAIRMPLVTPELAHALDSVADMYAEAAQEDNAITEAIQKARRSPVFTQHYFSPFWDEPHYHFTQLVLDDLTRND